MARGLTRSLSCLMGIAVLTALVLGQGCPPSGSDKTPSVAGNRPPQAQLNQALALSASVGDVVTLDASASWDPDADRLTFRWTQVSGPLVTVNSADQAVATFTPAEVGIHIFEVEVSDGRDGSDTASVRVSVTGPAAPGDE